MRWSSTDGLSIIELLVAVVVFTVAMLIGGRAIVGFVHQVGVSEVHTQATQFALEELERVRLLPYDSISSSLPEPVPDAPEYTRWVDVVNIGGDLSSIYDYRVITVTVVPPAELAPVSVTTGVTE